MVSLDEEISGGIGMEAFTKTKEFKELNVGFALDEGGPTPDDVFALFYGEKARWGVYILQCINFVFDKYREVLIHTAQSTVSSSCID